MKVLLLTVLAASVASEDQEPGLFQPPPPSGYRIPGGVSPFFFGEDSLPGSGGDEEEPGSPETFFQQPSSAGTPLDLEPFLAPIYLQYAPKDNQQQKQQPAPLADSFFRQQPASSGPTFQQPASSGPIFQQPASSGPTFQQPVSSGPIFQQPASSGPTFQQPAPSPDSTFQEELPASSGSTFQQPAPSSIFRQPTTDQIFQQPAPAPTFQRPALIPLQTHEQPAPPYEGPVQYDFSYDVDAYDPEGNKVEFGHQEERTEYETSGSYFVLLPDKRLMNVKYYVDKTGFHPIYTYEGEAIHPQPAHYQPPQPYSIPSKK